MSQPQPTCWSEKHKMRRGCNGPALVMYCRDCKGSGASLPTHWMPLPAFPGQAAESYRQANPLGGPAKVFDAIADAIRAGDPVDQAMREFGVCWQAAPEARMPTDDVMTEIARDIGDEEKHSFIFNKDGRFSIHSYGREVIRKFCEVNGISLSGAKAGDKEGKVG